MNLRTWMDDSRIKSKRLPEICIPGSHNSAASRFYGRVVFSNFVHCNNLSVTEQLEICGCRFIDIRVSDGTSDNICVSHRFIVVDSVSTILSEICGFLQRFPSEVVIISVSKDYDRDFTRHHNLYQMMSTIFGDLMPKLCSDRLLNKTVGELVQINQRLVIIGDVFKNGCSFQCSDDGMDNSWYSCHNSDVDQLFSNIEQKWVNVGAPIDSIHRQRLNSTGLATTKDVKTIIKDVLKIFAFQFDAGLESDGEKCKKLLCDKMNNEWKSRQLNLVSVDYIDAHVGSIIVAHNFTQT
ncbi:1-phosphatidylinositol phosphodiesterase [Acrasis kona]|uniref:1-phosphatidylinositol phosphodiesterase n=1 Tax=Acrasis kona TaxID=1008807 RepID=A0AAW2YMT4_9EUKA